MGLTFSQPIKKSIIEISSGFPYFTHLLCKECAEEAIRQSKTIIDRSIFEQALIVAVKNTEGKLKRCYDLAVTSSRTDMYSQDPFICGKI
ncbi:hypothetical protein ACLBOM_28880 [Escherichia coli]